MTTCDTCNKDFKAVWRLERHLSKKNPCRPVTQNNRVKIEKDPKSHAENAESTQNSSLENENDTKQQPSKNIDSKQQVSKRCQFCNKECKKNIKRHENICPMANDEVREIEIELGIPYTEHDKLTCRFCKIKYTRPYNLRMHQETCNEKKTYLAILQGQQIAKSTGRTVNIHVYNITNNNDNRNTQNDNRSINNTQNDNRSINNTQNDNRSINNIQADNRSINNIQANVPELRKFGNENISHISKELIFDAMKRGVDYSYTRMAHELHCNPSHPENHNLRLTNIRSAVMDVFNGREFEKQPVDEVLATVMKKATDLMFGYYFSDEKYYDSNTFVRTAFRKLDDLDTSDPKEMKVYKQKVKCKLYNKTNQMKTIQ